MARMSIAERAQAVGMIRAGIVWLVNPILHIIIWLTTRVIINNFFHFNKNHL